MVYTDKYPHVVYPPPISYPPGMYEAIYTDEYNEYFLGYVRSDWVALKELKIGSYNQEDLCHYVTRVPVSFAQVEYAEAIRVQMVEAAEHRERRRYTPVSTLRRSPTARNSPSILQRQTEQVEQIPFYPPQFSIVASLINISIFLIIVIVAFGLLGVFIIPARPFARIIFAHSPVSIPGLCILPTAVSRVNASVMFGPRIRFKTVGTITQPLLDQGCVDGYQITGNEITLVRSPAAILISTSAQVPESIPDIDSRGCIPLPDEPDYLLCTDVKNFLGDVVAIADRDYWLFRNESKVYDIEHGTAP